MSERAQIVTQVVIVALVMGAAVYGIVTSTRAEPPAISAPAGTPDASLIASTVRSPTPSPTASPRATPTQAVVTLPPSASPTVVPKAPDLVPYRSDEPHCFCIGVVTRGGWTVQSPFDAALELHVYQLINGGLREGSDVAGIPSYPYVILTSSDGRRLVYRPGALDSDTKLVTQTASVRAGDDLFRIIGPGASSWHDFYDRTVGAQVIVSLTAGSGADLDPTRLMLFAAR